MFRMRKTKFCAKQTLFVPLIGNVRCLGGFAEGEMVNFLARK